jgi:hypothetical protein
MQIGLGLEVSQTQRLAALRALLAGARAAHAVGSVQPPPRLPLGGDEACRARGPGAARPHGAPRGALPPGLISLSRANDAQAGGLGEASIDVQLPPWLLLGDDGAPITRARLAPSDVAAGLFGLCAASADLASGHSIFGLNNMIACLLATDILQARPRGAEVLEGF